MESLVLLLGAALSLGLGFTAGAFWQKVRYPDKQRLRQLLEGAHKEKVELERRVAELKYFKEYYRVAERRGTLNMRGGWRRPSGVFSIPRRKGARPPLLYLQLRKNGGVPGIRTM